MEAWGGRSLTVKAVDVGRRHSMQLAKDMWRVRASDFLVIRGAFDIVIGNIHVA